MLAPWKKSYDQPSSVQLLSHVRLFVTPWTAARQASLSITNSWSLFKLMSIASVLPSNHLSLCHLRLLLPSIFPISRSFLMSQLFASGSKSIGASASVLEMNIQVWFSCCPRDSQESSPTLQLESINSLALSLLNGPNFTSIDNFYMTTGKNRAFTIWKFLGKVMPLLFNILNRSVIAFLPRSKRLFIHGCSHGLQWFLEPKNIKSVTAFSLFPWSDGTGCHDLRSLNAEI